jgi:hypothetical protein
MIILFLVICVHIEMSKHDAAKNLLKYSKLHVFAKMVKYMHEMVFIFEHS